MRALCEGLNSLQVDKAERNTVWTTAVKTKLYEIGHGGFGYKVYASQVDNVYRDGGDWLYDPNRVKIPLVNVS